MTTIKNTTNSNVITTVEHHSGNGTVIHLKPSE